MNDEARYHTQKWECGKAAAGRAGTAPTEAPTLAQRIAPRGNDGCDKPDVVRVTADNDQEIAMTKPSTPPEAETDLPPGVPKGPSKADLDQISKDQALIMDEWAPAPAPSETEAPSQ